MNIVRFILFLLILIVSNHSIAQSNWMIAEKISNTNRWNRAFYTRLNAPAQLEHSKTDSTVYCKDCSVTSILFKALLNNTLSSAQLLKGQTMFSVSISEVYKKYNDYQKSAQPAKLHTLDNSIHSAEIIVYRRPVTAMPYSLKEVPAEWIALEIKDTTAANKKTPPFRIYMRAADCFAILNQSGCQWTHPVNFEYTSSYSAAFTNRNYLVQEYTLVSVQTLQAIPEYARKEKMPTLAYNLLVNDPNKSHSSIPSDNGTSNRIHLFAVCSADIREQKNLGYHKADLPSLLISLFEKNQLAAYIYHQEGFFSPLLKEELQERLLVEVISDNEASIKLLPANELYQLHIFKELTKENATVTVKNEWLMLGTTADQSSAFQNTYTIAFRFDDVVRVLGNTKIMWFNGTNQQDSSRLDEALRTQRIAYSDMFAYTIYNDTILHLNSKPVYTEIKYEDRLSQTLNLFTQALIADYDGANKRITRISKTKITSYPLTYYFNETSNTILTKNSMCREAMLQAIKEKKLIAFDDASLHSKISSADVLYKLDKSRFYKTGNVKKDSIYISTLSDSIRYISPSQLTEFYLYSNYTIQDGKESSKPVSLGIIIPADQNPQYDTETLCYVSFPAFVQYVSQSKEYKKYASPLASLQNEKAIIRVTDFYNVLLYEHMEDEDYYRSGVTMPAFIQQHVAGKKK